jgi:L-rhamnose-H+ transport protein
VLVVVLVGGFATNFIWCLILNIRNRTGYQYFSARLRGGIPARAAEPINRDRAPMLSNYCFCALAGSTWYMQFFFYTMGETQMGNFKFSSWTLHMASIIIFSTLWGIALKEWKGVGTLTKTLVALSLFVLVASTVIVGYGNYLGRVR